MATLKSMQQCKTRTDSSDLRGDLTAQLLRACVGVCPSTLSPRLIGSTHQNGLLLNETY